GLQRGRYLPRAFRWLPRLRTLRFHGFAAALQLRLIHREMDRAGRDVDLDPVAVLHEANEPAIGGFRRDVSDRQARGAAGEAAVGDERAGLAEALRFQIARGIEHLLHARAAARAFIDHHDDVAGFDLAREDRLDGGILALDHAGGAREFQDAGV